MTRENFNKKPGAKSDAKPGARSNAKPGARSSAKPGAKAWAKPKAKAGTKPGAKSWAKPGANPGAQPGAKPGGKPSARASNNPGAENEIRLSVTKPTELLVFLLEQLPEKNRKDLKSFLAHFQVQVDNQVVSQFNHPLRKGQVVTIQKGKVSRGKKIPGLEILYEDGAIIVINKKEGLLSIATAKEKERTAYGLLSDYVTQKDPRHGIFIVHRLDRETSGVMMFAKTKEAQQTLQHNWQEAVQERSYLAVVEGTVTKAEGVITSWLKENKNLKVYTSQVEGEGEKAITHYKLLKAGKYYSLLEVELETGKKNQIRVHMQELGHSVVGDKKYGSTKNPLKRLGLHAHRLVFNHPVTGKLMRFETEIPAAFTRLFLEVLHEEE